LPYDILSDKRYVNLINDRWNKNVLLMGDFNDDPFDKSISKFLRAKNNREIYTELNESWRFSEIQIERKRINNII
jgi:endonuclease/exonuclease/phosphatase family metal-dependent hydrolase